MKNFFTNDELEGFLKESADGLRMRPSDKVWKGVSNKLNERRRRMGFATATFLLLTSALGYFLLTDSKSALQPTTAANAAINASFKNPLLTSVVGSQSSSGAYMTPVISIAEKNRDGGISLLNSAVAQTEDAPSAPAIIRQLYPKALNNNVVLNENAPEKIEQVYTGTISKESFTSDAEDALPVEEPVIEDKAPALLTVENVTNIFRNVSKKKVSFQFFFTPTVSYRKLTENKSYLRSVPSTGSVSYAELYNINDIVTHKPDIGLELGFAAKYPIAKSIQLRGGMQFNMNRYDIKAFTNATELATIALNNGNNGVQMVGARSNYRNFGAAGNNADWLQNVSFQVSAPIGLEAKVAGSSKGTSFGVAGTVQPTYVLGDRAYLLSTDYKNYSEVSWLMRRWNVASSVETFVAYSTGKIKWQVGPQIRYQLLSSFVTKYPVKENLFDFGLKVGISLNDNKASETNK